MQIYALCLLARNIVEGEQWVAIFMCQKHEIANASPKLGFALLHKDLFTFMYRRCPTIPGSRYNQISFVASHL